MAYLGYSKPLSSGHTPRLMTRYQISLEAEGLPRLPLWSRLTAREGDASSHLHAEVSWAGAPTLLLGRTEDAAFWRHDRRRRLQWLRPIIVDIAPSSLSASLVVRVLREDGTTLGDVTVEPLSILRSPGRVRVASTDSGIAISVSLEESVRGTAAGVVRLQLRGLDVKNVEPGPLGLGRSDPGFEIAKKALDAGAGIVRWIPVYRSEFIMNHLNPFWDEFALGLEELCYCDLDWPLLIRVHDFQRAGRSRPIGAVETTLRLLLHNVAVRGNADRHTAFEILRAGRDGDADLHAARGLLVVVQAEVVAPADHQSSAPTNPYIDRGTNNYRAVSSQG